MFEFLERKGYSSKDELREILGEYELPSFPRVALEAIAKIRDPNSTSSEIADVLAMDPALSVKVLATANSATFGLQHRADTVSHAVTMVGMDILESLIVTASAGKAVPRRSAPGYEFERFWRTSYQRGIVARGLAEKLCPSLADKCLLAGFMQDLAIPFLATSCSNIYGPVLERWHNEPGSSLAELEREFFNWDHAEVATWILDELNLAEAVASAIGGHHDPENVAYDCPPPVFLVSLLREEASEAGYAALIDAATTQHDLPQDLIVELLEVSEEYAHELVQLIV